jgi:hypothetical protein
MRLFMKPLLSLALFIGLAGCPPTNPDNTTPQPNGLKCPTGAMANGQCYASTEEACTAIGCAQDKCLAALSKPPIVSCKESPKCDPKQTVANGKCFDTAEAACTEIGCPGDQCIVARSAPGIASCKSTPK